MNPGELAIDALGQSLGSQRLADSGGVLQQNMTLADQRQKQKPQPVIGYHCHRADVLLQRCKHIKERLLGQNPRLAKTLTMYQLGVCHTVSVLAKLLRILRVGVRCSYVVRTSSDSTSVTGHAISAPPDEVTS